jgi:lysophospholipase L1-like esterase
MTSNRIVSITVLAALALAGTAWASEQSKVYDLKPNERILVLGDSTTHDGNTVGGYVRLVDQAIQEQVPDRKAAIRAHAGYGAPLVPDRPEKRQTMTEWFKPVLGHPNAPTTVMINLGLNDSKQGEAHVPTYEKWVRQYVEELRAAKMNVILCTPTLWGGLKQTKSYAEAVRRVATEMKCPLIDLYAAHAAALEQKKVLTCDGTHLNTAGEVLSASTILKAIGLKAEWKKHQLRISARRNGYSTGVEGWCGGPLIGNTRCVVAEPALPEGRPELENPKGKFGHSDCLWIANWPTQQAAYAPGTKVTLKLDPASGRIFHHWADWDGLLPKDAPATLTIIMDGHKAVDLSYEMPAGEKGK